MEDKSLDRFLVLRRHLKIVHHVRGRIRLRVAATVRTDMESLDRGMLDRVLGAIEGIRDVRLNALAGTVVIHYATREIKPVWWETLLNGSDEEARSLLRQLLQGRFASAVQAARGS